MTDLQSIADSRLVEQTVFTVIPIVFALLHLLLYCFSRQRRDNLYFAILTSGFALAAHYDFLLDQGGTADYVVSLQRTGIVIFAVAAGRFSFAIYDTKPSRVFRWIVAIATIGLLVGWYDPRLWGGVLAILIPAMILLVADFRFRIKNPQPGGWILRAGLLMALGTGILDVLMDAGVLPSTVFGTSNPWLYGGLSLLASMSIYLAFTMSATRRQLELRLIEIGELSKKALEQERQASDREIERRLLEADNQRKTHELEAARVLQLSMLPRNLPTSKNWEIAASMTTASEVGGDYYDAELQEDGVLTLAIGDAVGHGASAGALVAATKSLFAAHSNDPDLTTTLSRFDAAISKLDIDRVFVALLLARLEGNQLQVASAGMPPPLLYRADSRLIEELQVSGMPLGSPMATTYTRATVEVGAGDVLLLMSDGFPELPDTAGDELGYDAARSCFQSVGSLPASAIIEGLSKIVRQRIGKEPPPDDVTFVVLSILDR